MSVHTQSHDPLPFTDIVHSYLASESDLAATIQSITVPINNLYAAADGNTPPSHSAGSICTVLYILTNPSPRQNNPPPAHPLANHPPILKSTPAKFKSAILARRPPARTAILVRCRVNSRQQRPMEPPRAFRRVGARALDGVSLVRDGYGGNHRGGQGLGEYEFVPGARDERGHCAVGTVCGFGGR